MQQERLKQANGKDRGCTFSARSLAKNFDGCEWLINISSDEFGVLHFPFK